MKNGVMLKPRSMSAFTLVELITVIAIITILTMIAVPNTISMMRSNRIESANTHANEIYSAVQNFLTDQQIKNLKLYNTTAVSGVFPIKKGDLSGSGSNKIIFSVQGLSSYYEGNPYTTSIDTTDTQKASKEKDVVSGIRKYLGSAITSEDNVYWAAQIDVDTYTVDWVLYSDQESAMPDIYEVMFNYSSSGELYSQVFQVNDVTAEYICQEYDVNHGGPKYVGQYPVPVKK